MILRLLLLLILFIVIARVFWRFVDNVIEAAGWAPSSHPRVPDAGVRMVRDPVCGMFVVPERALTLADGRGTQYFCSTSCRDKYRRESSEGRTA